MEEFSARVLPLSDGIETGFGIYTQSSVQGEENKGSDEQNDILLTTNGGY